MSETQDSTQKLFENGDFAGALAAIRESEMRSPSDWNNSGLILYKNGQLEKAYAYFLKAKTLGGDNRDSTHNLQVIAEKLKMQGITASQQSILVDQMGLGAKSLTVGWVGLPLGILLTASAFFLKAAKRQRAIDRPLIRIPAFGFALFFLILTILLGGGFFYVRGLNLMVVSVPVAEVLSGPAKTYSTVHKIAPMTVVRATGDRRVDTDGKEWHQIEFGNENIGWTRAEELLAL